MILNKKKLLQLYDLYTTEPLWNILSNAIPSVLCFYSNLLILKYLSEQWRKRCNFWFNEIVFFSSRATNTSGYETLVASSTSEGIDAIPDLVAIVNSKPDAVKELPITGCSYFDSEAKVGLSLIVVIVKILLKCCKLGFLVARLSCLGTVQPFVSFIVSGCRVEVHFPKSYTWLNS